MNYQVRCVVVSSCEIKYIQITHKILAPTVACYCINDLTRNGQSKSFLIRGSEHEFPGFTLVVGAKNPGVEAAKELVARLYDVVDIQHL